MRTNVYIFCLRSTAIKSEYGKIARIRSDSGACEFKYDIPRIILPKFKNGIA